VGETAKPKQQNYETQIVFLVFALGIRRQNQEKKFARRASSLSKKI